MSTHVRSSMYVPSGADLCCKQNIRDTGEAEHQHSLIKILASGVLKRILAIRSLFIFQNSG